jgi:putative oxidoreductase
MPRVELRRLFEAAKTMKKLNVVLWIGQVLLAGMFLMTGSMKIMMPASDLAAMFGSLPLTFIRFIGIAEIAAVIGLILPAVTRIMPRLTPLAAVGLTIVMAGAIVFHLSRGEWPEVPVVFGLGCLAGFVAWGRGLRVPIASRTVTNRAAGKKVPAAL